MTSQRTFIIQTKYGPVRMKKLDKEEARRRFYEGEDIYIAPYKFKSVDSEFPIHSVINLKSGKDKFDFYSHDSKIGFYVVDD